MLNFKKGDSVYWFEFPHSSRGKMRDISLKSGICESYDEHYIKMRGLSMLHLRVDVFHSRQEAIDAMIKRMEALQADK